jgi:threonine-phosphate decarboxylase
VNAAAQAAGVAALADLGHLALAREEVRRGKAFLLARLDALGLPVSSPAANFLLVRVGDAARVRRLLLERRLLRQGIAVRDCTSFGLPHHLRIAVRKVSECHRLVDALDEVLTRG